MLNIGIVGRKRSGKDTAANFLVEELGYVRHGLADPLKDAALALDPIVDADGDDYGIDFYRLSTIVEWVGWEKAKDDYPEVRRILQKLGDEAGRQVHGEETWILNLLKRVARENQKGRPVVVPDVRYPNEADELRAAGFRVIRIDRPGFSDPQPGEHASEQVERLEVGGVIVNDGSLDTLRKTLLAWLDATYA